MDNKKILDPNTKEGARQRFDNLWERIDDRLCVLDGWAEMSGMPKEIVNGIKNLQKGFNDIARDIEQFDMKEDMKEQEDYPPGTNKGSWGPK